MKNYLKLATAVVALVMVTAIVVTFEACRKDAKFQNQPTVMKESAIVHPDKIDDMNKYLKDFIVNMQSSKNDDVLSIAEAEWHLTNIANYEYANVVSDYSDIRFDTIYSKVRIENNQITLSSLNDAYEIVAKQIRELYKSLNLDDKNIKYISSSVHENGDVVSSIIMTYSNSSKWFYFPNDDFCDLYFDDNTNYPANGLAVTELTRIFNLLEGRPTEPSPTNRMYYTVTRTKEFHYYDYYDSIANRSRLFCTNNYYYSLISKDDMCYLLDSYLGLAKEYEENPFGNSIVKGVVTFLNATKTDCTGNHLLTVSYGVAVSNPYPPSL